MLESKIQSSITLYLKNQGCLTVKNMTMSLNGWPDITVIPPNGEIYYIEVKAEKGRLSRIQMYRIAQLREHNVTVYIVNSLKQLKEELNDRSGTKH